LDYNIRMAQTNDQTIYEMSMEAGGFSDSSPFVNKQNTIVNDSNNGSYTTNMVVFDGVSIANSGRYNDFTSSIITIPIVIQVNNTGGAAVNFTTVSSSDLMIALKNSNTSLLHSCQIDVGNGTTIQSVPHINIYEAFSLHTELSAEEEDRYLAQTGYAMDTPQSWSYRGATASSSVGVGLCNNSNGYEGTAKTSTACEAGYEAFNSGMVKRQSLFRRLASSANTDGRGHDLVFGNNTEQHLRNAGFNYVENTATAKYYHYTACIRVRDLLLFSSPDFPKLLKGAFFKLSLVINQCFLRFGKDANGLLTFDNANCQITSGGSCPLLVASSYTPTFSAPNGAITAVTAPNVVNRPCGSALLPLSDSYEVSLSIVRTQFTHTRGAAQQHHQTQCRWIIPSYQMNPIAEQNYLSKGQARIRYLDVQLFEPYNIQGSFQLNLTQGIARAKRMIICPFLSAAGNDGVPELRSPFSTAPATTAPIIINNFQVNLSGVNVFTSGPLNYSFEMFNNELSNTSKMSANQQAGISSGRLGLREWASGMYNYFVIDLRRHLPEDDGVLLAISVSGNIVSPKSYDFKIFVEYEKEIVLDLATGARLQ